MKIEDTETNKGNNIRPAFLDKFGAGKTEEDEIIKNLISTCEEGIDYTKV